MQLETISHGVFHGWPEKPSVVDVSTSTTAGQLRAFYSDSELMTEIASCVGDIDRLQQHLFDHLFDHRLPFCNLKFLHMNEVLKTELSNCFCTFTSKLISRKDMEGVATMICGRSQTDLILKLKRAKFRPYRLGIQNGWHWGMFRDRSCENCACTCRFVQPQRLCDDHSSTALNTVISPYQQLTLSQFV